MIRCKIFVANNVLSLLSKVILKSLTILIIPKILQHELMIVENFREKIYRTKENIFFQFLCVFNQFLIYVFLQLFILLWLKYILKHKVILVPFFSSSFNRSFNHCYISFLSKFILNLLSLSLIFYALILTP